MQIEPLTTLYPQTGSTRNESRHAPSGNRLPASGGYFEQCDHAEVTFLALETPSSTHGVSLPRGQGTFGSEGSPISLRIVTKRPKFVN